MILQKIYFFGILSFGLALATPTPTTIFFPDPDDPDGVIPAYLDGEVPFNINAGDNSSITFHLLRRDNKTEEIIPYSIDSVESSSFIPNAPLKILAHGFGNNYLRAFPYRMGQAFLKHGGDMNVILIDWKKLATSPWYTIAAPATKLVGITAANFLKFLIDEDFLSVDQIHVIGYSLGAHVAGNIGHEFDGEIPRVTALDPAMPLFDITSDENRIDPSDGKYVEVIHTASGHLHENGLSFFGPRGHADFYPNGGTRQPGCETETFGTCSHGRAPNLYEESIRNKDSLLACRCGHWSLFLAGKCDCSKPIPFGISSPTTSSGKYYLLTGEKSSYGMGLNGLTNIKPEVDDDTPGGSLSLSTLSASALFLVITLATKLLL